MAGHVFGDRYWCFFVEEVATCPESLQDDALQGYQIAVDGSEPRSLTVVVCISLLDAQSIPWAFPFTQTF